MISAESLSQQWYQNLTHKYGKFDKILVEKAIRALMLVEALANTGLHFIFKGGTSLLILLKRPERFSIDVDILVSTGTKIEKYLNKIELKKTFIKFEKQNRLSTSHIKKAHFKFYYQPILTKNPSVDFILLDVLFEKNNYQKVLKKELLSDIVKQSGKPSRINIPSIDDLLGDKLTAFAPNSSGIPYFKSQQSMTMEIIKQLFDVGRLFDNFNDLKIVAKTFKQFALTELAYRDISSNFNIVLDDVFNTSLLLSTRGHSGEGDFSQLQQGISRLKPYIFSGNYNIERSIIDAAKAAYLSLLIKIGKTEFERLESIQRLPDYGKMEIRDPFDTKLNKLKKSNPFAFFYWFKTYQLSTSL